MTDPFIERALVGPLPDFQARWRELRRTYPPDSPPGTEELLAHVVAHVQHALEVGRVAEVTRFFLAVERLLGEADPVLAEMLEEQLLGTLARECRESAVAPERVLPHLGPRARAVWDKHGR